MDLTVDLDSVSAAARISWSELFKASANLPVNPFPAAVPPRAASLANVSNMPLTSLRPSPTAVPMLAIVALSWVIEGFMAAGAAAATASMFADRVFIRPLRAITESAAALTWRMISGALVSALPPRFSSAVSLGPSVMWFYFFGAFSAWWSR